MNFGNDVKTSVKGYIPGKNICLYGLWSLLSRTRFAIARMRELELLQFNLTIEQASVLHILQNNGHPMTIEELEDITMRQPHSISTLVNRMVKAGLLSKEKSPDGKKLLISPTLEARDVFLRVTSVSLEMTFSALEPEDRQRLEVRLSRLLKKARQLLGVSSHPLFMQYVIQERTSSSEKTNSP
jgi:DNA-binding MarR family transcriptional regulator